MEALLRERALPPWANDHATALTTDARAVILKKEVDVLSGPDPNDTVLFKLHEGAIVKHERLEDGWALVQVSEEKRGWVPAKDLERIIMDIKRI